MSSQRSIQSNNNKLIATKVNIIYELLCKEDVMELTELLSSQNILKNNPKYYINRKKALQLMLRKMSSSMTKMKSEYQFFKISQLYMNDILVFDESFFFDSDVDTFRKKVEEYVEYLQTESIDIDLDYKYIYLFDNRVNSFIYYQIEFDKIKNMQSQDGLMMRVFPPKDKASQVEYSGTIKKRENQIVLMFENRYDSVHMIFNTSLIVNSTSGLLNENYYGLAIGISDQNQQTAISKKVILSKKIFSKEDKEQLYLILNETQTLEAKENIYALEPDMKLDADYLGKYYQNFKDLHRFFSNVKYSEFIDTTIMHQMVFTELHVFQKMFEKFSKKQDYFLNDRKRVCFEFMRFLQSHPDEKAILTIPIFSLGENIFLYRSLNKKSIKILLIELAKRGVDITIMIVLENRADYQNGEMVKVFKQLHKSGISLNFVAKNDIEKEVSSCDFCYTKSGLSAIYKSQMRYKEMYTITQNREQIKNLMIDFKNIRKKSYTYEEFDNGATIIEIKDLVLKKIIGTWYLYFYGSFNYLDGRPIFWKISINVKSDYSVVEDTKQARAESGKVEISKKQTIFTLKSIKTENTFYMVMNNTKISDVTSVMIYSQQDQKNLDMAMIGIISREKLMDEEAQILLGNSKQTVLKVDPMFQIRIDDFLLAQKVSYMS